MEDFSAELINSGSGLEENYFITCASRSLPSINNSSVPITPKVLSLLNLSALLIAGTLLNFLVVFLIIKSKILKTRSFIIALQICMANLGTLLICLVPSTISIFKGYLFFPLHYCIANGYLIHVLIDVRILLIFLHSLDRFASVFAPFSYPRHSSKTILFISVLAWLIIVVVNLIGLPQILDCYSVHRVTLVCNLSSDCSAACKILQHTHVVVVLYSTMFLSLGFTLALYVKARRIRQRESEMMGLSNNQMTSSDRKALKTFLLLISTIIVSNTAIGAFTFLPRFQNSWLNTFLEIIIAAGICLYLITDPIVMLRNADAREALKVLRKSLIKAK